MRPNRLPLGTNVAHRHVHEIGIGNSVADLVTTTRQNERGVSITASLLERQEVGQRADS
jgi:hypothetical protein